MNHEQFILEIPDMSEDSVWGENLTQPQLFSVKPYYTLIMFSFLTQGKTLKKNLSMIL